MQLTAATLRQALTEGTMRAQAASLSRRELAALIDFLAARARASDDWLLGWACPSPGEGAGDRHAGGVVDGQDVRTGASGADGIDADVVLARPGVDLGSSRHLTAAAAGLDRAAIMRLDLAWAIGFPDTTSLRASGVIVGRTLFYSASATGRVLAVDIDAPCLRWAYAAGTALRSSPSFGRLGADGPAAVVFSDQRGLVHAVDIADGRQVWKVDPRHDGNGMVTGAPIVHGERVIVPVSASGVGSALDPRQECCDGHGSVVALDARSGRVAWTYHTMPDAGYTGQKNRSGVRMRGPSGAPIWSTPTIDVRRNAVYVTTGQNTSLPATTTSDAVIALDAATGVERWHFQALANDVWNLACAGPGRGGGANCPGEADSVLKDFDFGASAVVVGTDQRGDLMLAGQKSGGVWALDAATGALAWHQRFGQGSALGGVHWGIASDGSRLFVPISDPVGRGGRPEPGMNAVDVATGRVLWRTPVQAACGDGRRKRFAACDSRFGLSAAPIVVDDVVIAGGLDGRVHAFAAESGRVLFTYDTLRDFTTVNGVAGNGGSIDSHSVFAGAGTLFVGSGYSGFGQAPGNVLLAFRPVPAAGGAAAGAGR
jgi:polyvinyl alcohol dehydrogenase (cytochrome)